MGGTSWLWAVNFTYLGLRITGGGDKQYLVQDDHCLEFLYELYPPFMNLTLTMKRNRGYEKSHLFTKVNELIWSYLGYLMNRLGAARLLQAIGPQSKERPSQLRKDWFL